MKLKKLKIKFILISLIFFFRKTNSVTIVYNLKIAQTTKSRHLEFEPHPFVAALTSVNQFRTRYIGSKQTIATGLTTLSYGDKDYYLRADFAFGNIKEEFKNLCISRTQTDDILFSGGISKQVTESTALTFSGLVGLPTHNDHVLQGIQIGTGHIGFGFQVDGSFYYEKNRKHMILGAARLIHFLPRKVELVPESNLFNFDFDLGNVADLYIAHQSSWKKSRIEYGYNATFAFNAQIQPEIPNFEEEAQFIRSSFFISYAHGFLIKKHILGIILGLSYGFDHTPKNLGFKRIWSLWLTGAVNF